ncbi:MAG TPA: serpin family protein [Longimicrobiales bacterium]|nr:serpin family protein [Longimicrobiales bacterium]
MSPAQRMAPFPSLLTLLGAVALTACEEPAAPGPAPVLTELPRALEAAEVRVIQGSNAFAFDLLREVVAEDTAANTFISPLSASMALGMAMNGAEGETWGEMRDALGFQGMEEPEINAAYRGLIDLLLGLDPGVEFAVGNSAWVDDGAAFLPDYLARLEEFFDAEARSLDLQDPASLDVINDWVATRTRDRIPRLLEGLPQEVVAVLVNAIYFKGDWREQFDRDRTSTAPFTRDDGTTVQVDMMSGQVGYRAVVGSDGARAVELPYGRDAFTAVAVLPPAGQPLDAWLARLDAATWLELVMGLDEQAPLDEDSGERGTGVTVRLPKLELEWDSSLKAALKRLGMEAPFSDLADFSRMNGHGGLAISDVIQGTFLKVDEEGTEAAAATAVIVGITSAAPTYTFDRPYLFVIRERLTGTILFMGAIGDPSA